jgi:adenine-specific DNA-methyltransferase
MVDTIIQGKTRTRREYCSFYTESDPILTYMVKRLGIVKGDLILEPCAGDGVFIEKILELKKRTEYKIEALDLNPHAVANLKDKFSNVEIRQTDTLLDLTLDWHANSGGYFTKIIGNPPYGAWQDYEKRDVLKKRYSGYVRETYALFIRRCIDLLRDGGRLTFIVPDTFLALHLHCDTRKKILEATKIEEILLIPSNFFPGVNFGYSNLCIISFVKCKDIKNHKIKIVGVNNSINTLYKIANDAYGEADFYEEIKQQKIIDSVGQAFLIGGNTKIRNLINKSQIYLGDIADCVTGFYSGDNKKFVMPKSENVRGAKGYNAIDENSISYDYLADKDLIHGLRNGKEYIPFLKGGRGVLKKETEWFVKWDEKTVEFYKNNKASRFQNSTYYFKEGIGVPMVKSSRANAFLLDKRLFDQSIVGVFPKEEKHLNYILAFLNSEVCTKILKVINHTANNSANYLKRLPIVLESNAITEIHCIICEYLGEKEGTPLPYTLNRIDKIFNELYRI